MKSIEYIVLESEKKEYSWNKNSCYTSLHANTKELPGISSSGGLQFT